MEISKKTTLIDAICRQKELNGESLSKYRAELEKLSEAELSQILRGKEAANTSKAGVGLEHAYDNETDSVNTETFKTEIDGEIIDVEITYNIHGYPVKRTEYKNGETLKEIKYTWVPATNETPAHTIVQEENPDGSSRETIALSVTDSGEIKDEDFLYSVKYLQDGSEERVFSSNGMFREDKITSDGKTSTTIYSGASYNTYLKNGLHRLAQQVTHGNKIYYVEYDGKGNTITTVQNNESPTEIARIFGVKLETLMKMNPYKGKNGIDQVGAKIRVPGEFDADSKQLGNRLSPEESVALYKRYSYRQALDRVYTSSVGTKKLNKNYNGNYWELAKDLLGAGATNEAIRLKVQELEILNAGNNTKLSNGSVIYVTEQTTNKKVLKELSSYGFSAGQDNFGFYNKFNRLNASQKQNVISMLRYFKSQKITDKNKIKAEILKVYPDINLFDSEKTIPMNGTGSHASVPASGMAFQPSREVVSLETFVTDYLGISLQSSDGQRIYERLNSMDQEALNKISAGHFVKQYAFSSPQLHLYKKDFAEVDRILNGYGITLKTADEIHQDRIRYKNSPEYEKAQTRENAARCVGLMYDQAIAMIREYQDSQGWLNIGFWREKLGGLLDLVIPDNDYVAPNHDAVIRRLERNRDFVVSVLRTNSANSNEFNSKFKEFTGMDYDEAKVEKFLEIAKNRGNKSDEEYANDYLKAYTDAFGSKITDEQQRSINIVGLIDGTGDIAAMIIGTGWLSKTSAFKSAASGTANFVGKLGLGNTAAMNLTRGLVGAELLGGWTASTGTVNLMTRKAETTIKDWQDLGKTTLISAGFGFMGGITADKLAQLESYVSKQASRMAGKFTGKDKALITAQQAAVDENTAAMTKVLESGKGMNGVEVWGKYLKNLSGVNAAGNIAKFAAEIGIFTGYDISVEVISDLLDKDGKLKDIFQEPAKLEEFLTEKLKENTTNLGLIKTIGSFIQMRLGGKYGSALADYEVLQRTNVKQMEINGVKKYIIEIDNGNRIIADSPAQVAAFYRTALYAETLSKNGTEAGGQSSGTTKQQPGTSGSYEEIKPAMISLTSPELKSTPVQNNGNVYTPQDIKNNIETIGIRNINGRSNLIYLSEDANTAKYGINTLDDLLKSNLVTKEEKQLIKQLYKHAQELGYKDLYDDNLHVLIGFASTAEKVNGKLVSKYDNLSKEQFEVIKYITDQCRGGQISDEHTAAILARINDPVPYEVFKYINNPEKLPDEITRGQISWSKEQCLEWIDEIKAMKGFLDTQSIPADITVQRVDDYSVMNNVTIDGKPLGKIMEAAVKNGKIEDVLKILNDDKSNIEVTYDNFIGTSMSKEKTFINHHDIKWEIDVPKGTKGAFLETAVTSNSIYDETEFLLQMGTTLKITGAEYKDGSWHIKAEVVRQNTPASNTAAAKNSQVQFPPTPLMDEAHGQKHGDNHLHKVYNTPKFQKEISSCLDALVEKIDHDFKPGKNLQHPVDYADYMMPDGTILSRNLLKDAKNGEILIYCIDTNGKQYYLCATTPENIAKAQKIYDYMSQLPEIPGRNYIKPLQEQIKAGKTFEEAMKIVEADMEKARIEANNRSEQALIANNAVKPSEYLVKPVNSPEFEGITLSAQEKIKAKVKHQDMNVLLQDKKLEALYKANAQPAIQLNVEAHLNHIYSRMSTELKPGETSVEVPYNTPVTLPDGTKIVRQKVTKLHPYYQRDGYETKYGLPNEPKEIISVTTPDGQTYTLPAVSIGSVNSAKRVLDLMGKAIAPKEQDYTPPKLPGADAAAEAKRVATIHKTIDNIKTKSTLITYLEQHSGFADGNKILTKENLTELLAPYNETNMQNLKEVLKYMYGESTNDSYTSERILDVLKSDFIKNPENADFIKQFLTEKSASVNDLIDVIIIDRTFTLAESDTAEAAKALFALKNKTNNPVLNVDNIILMTNNYKGKNAEYYNRLADILNIKDEQGSYVINAENFPILNPEAIDFLMKDNKLVHPDVLNLLNRNLAKAEAGNIDVKGLNIMNALYNKNPDITVTELVRKTKEFAVDKKITDPKLAEIGNKYLSPDLNTQLFDIQTIMADVKDERILEYVNKELDEIIAKHPEGRQLNDKINEIQNVLDIYHSVNSDYVNIGGGNYSPYYRQFINYLKKSNPDLANKLIKQPTLIEKYITQPAYNSLREDFNNDMQFGQLINYCKEHPNSELSEHFYENYFLKNVKLPQAVKQKCIEINNKYGVKVIPSANPKEAKEVFNYIEKEFNEWQTASGGQAKLPPVLDFMRAKEDYFNPERAYGQSVAGGFAESYTNQSVSLDNMTLSSVQYTLRHEITHINDTKKGCALPEGVAAQSQVLDPETGTTNTKLDFPNCKYREEFLRAGIAPLHVSYAYNNADEFIAVAAEGDMSKYSPEFKKLLLDLGMPEYMFKMKVTNPNIIKGVKEAEQLQKIYPDETLEEIYYSYEKDIPEPVVPEPVQEPEPAAIPEGRNITYAANGNEVPAKEVNEAVQEIRTRYGNKESDIRKYLDEAGLGEIGSMKGRLKSETSLYDKIANYMKEHPNATLDEAISDVRDAFGARTVIETDYNYKNHPEVKALLDAGDERGAMLKAAELQSQPALEKLKGMLLAQSQGKDGLETARISNYVSDDGIPYFSEAQLAELKQYGASIGVNVNYVVKLDKSDPNYAKMKAEGYKPTTKAQPSGYTALQINFKTKTGEVIEWQYRGDKVDRFAEGEHIPYDLRTDKNIIGDHEELEPLYNPIKELLSEDNMSEGVYNEYNRYLTDYYTHLRKSELGFESVEPKLSDYGNGYKFDERLSAENLIALHEAADKLKNGKISQQEAINEYNAAVQKNTPVSKTYKDELLELVAKKGSYWLNSKEMNVVMEKLPQIKDEKILDAIKTKLNSDKVIDIRGILALCEIEDFKAGGYEALSPELKNLIQPSSFYTKKDLNVQLEEIKAIQDPVLRQEKLDEFNINVLSNLILTPRNEKITDYLYDNYLQPAIPDKYKQAMTEISNATGKKVLPSSYSFRFEKKPDSYVQMNMEALANYNNLSDFQKDLFKRHADKMLVSDYWLTNPGYETVKTLTVEDIKVFEERNLAKYIMSLIVKELPELINLDETRWNTIQKFDLFKYTEYKYDPETKYESPSTSASNIIDIVTQCSDEEIQNMIKRNIFSITPKGFLSLKSDMMIALAKLDDKQWDYIVNDLHLIKDNVLDIHNNDVTGGLEAVNARYVDYETTNANIVKFLSNLNNNKSSTEELTSLGYKPEIATDEIGHLYDGINPEDTKDFKFNSTTWKEKIEKIENEVEKAVYEHPELYVNGEYASREECNTAIAEFFKDKNKLRLAELNAAIDKEGMNHLMRKRFDDVEEYLDITNNFNIKDFELLTNLCNSYNSSGKPFMPTQKVEFIDLINAYKMNGLDTSKMEAMIEAGKVDVAELHMDLFNKIMKNSGMTDEEISSIPIEKLSSWDTKYTHLLAKEIQGEFDIRDELHIPTQAGDKTFSDLIRAANLDDFSRYIHDVTNIYGKSNANTKGAYNEAGINYETWINPPKSAEVHFVTKDKNQEHLQQISAQLLEDINTLRQTPVKGFIDKQFPKYIKDGEFIIPSEIMSNKAKLKEFTNNIIKQLDSVWKRAQGNASSEDPKRAAMAKNTLTVLSHLQTRLEDIENVPASTVQKSLDLTVKMWDRNPQKDIFQGNYSTCCIGMGGGNGSAMPHYLMNTSYNMIELVDNTTGKTIGNALVYFVKDKNGEPAFIIDNIEINNGAKPSEEGGLKLRDAIVEYASNVTKAVTGRDDVNIYMSGSYNDVPCSDLPVENQQVSFLGDLDTDNIYMDLYKGWVEKSEFTKVVELLKLK